MEVYLRALTGGGGLTRALHPTAANAGGALAQVLFEVTSESRQPHAEPHFPAVIRLDENTDIVVGLTPRQESHKRLFDIVLSIVCGLFALPLMVIIALAVWVMSGRPVVFRQQRVGRGGRLFTLLKFRTMCVGAEKMLATDCLVCDLYRSKGIRIPSHTDSRVTTIGRLLRKTNADELPQLWNVLRGDMSLVGPRPVVPTELEEYGQLTPLYCATRPGLTGRWQVLGRDEQTFPQRALTELTFLCGWSIWSDLKTVVLTIPTVIRGTFRRRTFTKGPTQNGDKPPPAT